MTFVRPEARENLWRAREMITGSGFAALGGYWVMGVGLLSYLGVVFILLGAALGVVGWQRFRFRGKGGGQGVVQVNEGQIAYFGPLSGGAVALSDLGRVALDGGSFPRHWILTTTTGDRLQIPVNAEGVEALFDVFAALPGMRTERMLSSLKAATPVTRVLWERRELVAERHRLH